MTELRSTLLLLLPQRLRNVGIDSEFPTFLSNLA